MGIVYKSTEHQVEINHDAGTYRIDTVRTTQRVPVKIQVGEVCIEEPVELKMTTSTGDVPLPTPPESSSR